MQYSLLVHFDVRFAVFVYSKLQLCGGVTWGDRVSESTPRAAATTQEGRTPTAAQYHSRVTETLPRPVYCVGQTAAAIYIL